MPEYINTLSIIRMLVSPQDDQLNMTTAPCSIPYAKAPFDHEQADIILRSSGPEGQIDFRFFKSLLALSSQVFSSMFSLPQASPSTSGVSANDEERDGLPIVLMAEDASVLAGLLKFCYPRSYPTNPLEQQFNSCQELLKVAQAAHKFDMPDVQCAIRDIMITSRFLNENPVGLFAVAVQYCLEAEAKVAAKGTLRLSPQGRGYIDELELITAGTLHRLMDYHVRCADAASKVADLNNLIWVTQETYTWFECEDCKAMLNCGPCVTISHGRRKWVVSKWWAEFMSERAAAVKDRPHGSTVTDISVLDEALGKASFCKSCRTRAFPEMREFCALFAAEIERAIDQVPFDLLV
ncbi:hypothetical protein HGRIS_005158 [Hohenbuehelia grisea]|uniref:BTB domain-containing protein n=1 Tax=Hohenbuehelia grisea TaxID=104357 RepID=A0ABR3JE52_9AGAR